MVPMLIRRYTKDDYPRLLSLIRCVYNDRIYERALQRFRWQFEQNPHNAAGDPLILVLEHQDTIIGMIATTAQRLKIGDAVYPAYWVGDFMVQPDFRGRPHAANLARTLTQQPYLMMGFPAGYTVNFWRRQGWMPFGQLVGYCRATRPKFFYHLKNGPIRRRLCLAYRCYDAMRFSFVNRISEGIDIVEIKYFDERFDRLWEKCARDHTVIQVRDSRWLNWRFFQCPYLSYRVLAAINNDEALGFIVLRHESVMSTLPWGSGEKSPSIHEGYIVDFQGQRQIPVLSALIQASISALKQADCEVIRMFAASGDGRLQRLLVENSFFVDKNKEQGVFCNNTGHDINAMIKRQDHWVLSRADSDMDFSS